MVITVTVISILLENSSFAYLAEFLRFRVDSTLCDVRLLPIEVTG